MQFGIKSLQHVYAISVAPKGGFSLALGLGARPCLCLIGAVGLSLCVRACVSVCLCVSLGIYGGGRFFLCVFCFVWSLLFLASERQFVLLFKHEKCHINKI